MSRTESRVDLKRGKETAPAPLKEALQEMEKELQRFMAALKKECECFAEVLREFINERPPEEQNKIIRDLKAMRLWPPERRFKRIEKRWTRMINVTQLHKGQRSK